MAVVRCYIGDALDADWKEARRCLTTLFQYLRADEYVKDAHLKLGVDVLDLIRSFGEDERIDVRYRNIQIRQMISVIEKRRAGRLARMAPGSGA